MRGLSANTSSRNDLAVLEQRAREPDGQPEAGCGVDEVDRDEWCLIGGCHGALLSHPYRERARRLRRARRFFEVSARPDTPRAPRNVSVTRIAVDRDRVAGGDGAKRPVTPPATVSRVHDVPGRGRADARTRSSAAQADDAAHGDGGCVRDALAASTSSGARRGAAHPPRAARPRAPARRARRPRRDRRRRASRPRVQRPACPMRTRRDVQAPRVLPGRVDHRVAGADDGHVQVARLPDARLAADAPVADVGVARARAAAPPSSISAAVAGQAATSLMYSSRFVKPSPSKSPLLSAAAGFRPCACSQVSGMPSPSVS